MYTLFLRKGVKIFHVIVWLKHLFYILIYFNLDLPRVVYQIRSKRSGNNPVRLSLIKESEQSLLCIGHDKIHVSLQLSNVCHWVVLILISSFLLNLDEFCLIVNNNVIISVMILIYFKRREGMFSYILISNVINHDTQWNGCSVKKEFLNTIKATIP